MSEEENSEMDKSELLSLVCHDMKNTLRTIEGYLGLMDEIDEELPEEHKNYFNKISKNVEEGSEILNTVDTLRNLESGEVIKEPVKLDPIVESIKDTHEDGMDIKYEHYGGEVVVGPLLRNAVNNIVGNSVEHSKGEKLRIYPEEEEETVDLIFEDDGEGFPNHVKERFPDIDFSRGLYLSNRIAEAYGGDMEITKESKIGGARVDLYLKKA